MVPLFNLGNKLLNHIISIQGIPGGHWLIHMVTLLELTQQLSLAKVKRCFFNAFPSRSFLQNKTFRDMITMLVVFFSLFVLCNWRYLACFWVLELCETVNSSEAISYLNFGVPIPRFHVILIILTLLIRL